MAANVEEVLGTGTKAAKCLGLNTKHLYKHVAEDCPTNLKNDPPLYNPHLHY